MKNYLVFLVSLILAIVVSEAGLRIYDYPASIKYGWGQSYNNGTNQLGYKGKQIAYTGDDFVIILLGDSQVANIGDVGWTATSVNDLPESLLEKKLEDPDYRYCLSSLNKEKFKVFSIAAAGWGQDQQLLALQQYLKLFRANLVILWETPENDIWNNAFPTHYPLNGTPKPTFTISENGQLIKVPKDEVIPRWMQFKLGNLIYHLVMRLDKSYIIGRVSEEVFGNKDYIKFNLWDPDNHWNKYLPRPLQLTNIIENSDSTEYLLQFNSDVRMDPIALEKSHFALGQNNGSERIEWMARLTNLLIKEIERLAINSEASFFAFSYSADDTDQPLYPPSGIYTVKGQTFSFSDAAAEKRLARINKNVNYHLIKLKENHWRISERNTHLSKVANREIVGHLAKIVIQQICE